jgi:hypothetical protein
MEVAAPYEGICDIPVLFWKPEFRTRNFPSVIVFTLAIGWYYLCGLFSQGGSTALFALIPFFFIMILAGGQAYIIANQAQCPPVPWWGFVGAAVIGIASGAIGWIGAKKGIEAAIATAAAIQNTSPPAPSPPPKTLKCPAGYTLYGRVCYLDAKLQEVPQIQPTESFANYRVNTENFSDMRPGAIPAFIFSENPSTNAGGGMSMTNTMASSSGGEKCNAPLANTDQTFIVDLYKNGKLITQAIGE